MKRKTRSKEEHGQVIADIVALVIVGVIGISYAAVTLSDKNSLTQEITNDSSETVEASDITLYERTQNLLADEQADNEAESIQDTESPNENKSTTTYILNTSSKKIHYPDCSYVEKININNYLEAHDFSWFIANGYTPCGVCKPIENPISSSQTQIEEQAEKENSTTYVLNTNSKKIHYPDCASAGQIKPEYYLETEDYNGSIDAGYTPCERCKPIAGE